MRMPSLLCSKADFWALSFPNPGSAWPRPCELCLPGRDFRGCGCLPECDKLCLQGHEWSHDALENNVRKETLPSALLVLWLVRFIDMRQEKSTHIYLTFLCAHRSLQEENEDPSSSSIVLREERLWDMSRKFRGELMEDQGYFRRWSVHAYDCLHIHFWWQECPSLHGARREGPFLTGMLGPDCWWKGGGC